ncbi:hypothetical protein GW796_00835 [archaeon]|nr:hypothetical protein [archaeon]NCQ50451.1 hypothetical protein [archaeon]
MNLDKNTFGKTPAALYLADYLNTLDQPLVAKRTGKIMSGFRNTILQLAKANDAGILTAHNLARVISSMRSNLFIEVGDSLASNLVTNIIVGEMKILLRKSSDIRKIEIMQKKVSPSNSKIGNITNKKGYVIANVTEDEVNLQKYTVNELTDEINADTLTEKWKIKMDKRNKTI